MLTLPFINPCFNLSVADALRGSTAPIIVTGAGGWLGRAALEMLDGALGDALAGRVTVFASSPRTVTLRSGRALAVRDFSTLERVDAPPGLILHFAFLTRGYSQSPDYVAANRLIARRVQGFIERNGALGVFLPSSGAVYRADGDPYGALKVEDEVNFRRLADAGGFPAAVIRIFNLAGPFINNVDAYALACIIRDVAKGGPIDLRADHPVYRSFVHIEDVMNIALAILLRGLDVGVFDTAGGEALEIGALAARVSLVLTGRALPIRRPVWRTGPAERYLGDAAGYVRAAGAAGVALHDLDRQIADTAGYLATLG
jgi:nucleoside-diphosphate-sugar epimerase